MAVDTAVLAADDSTAQGSSTLLSPGDARLRVGTLVYTKAALVSLFVWLLWGDVCFMLMEAVPGLIPLKLKALNAPNWVMALILSTLPNLLNATVCPWVSYKSDRHRGKWGRRIPFMLFTAPFLTVALVLIGLSEPIGRWLHPLLASSSPRFSQNALTIGLIGVFTTLFTFFNMFVGSVFTYLFNDVVPEVVLSRFLSATRMVGTGALTFYNFFVLPFGQTNMALIIVGAALLYFIFFTLMCLNVREGQYAPLPAVDPMARPDPLLGIKTYMRECFSHRFYWLYFLNTAALCVGMCIGMFGMIYQQQMGLTMGQIGTLGGIWSAGSFSLLYFGGIVADRYHPLRILLLASGITTFIITPVGLLWLFTSPTPSQFFYVSIVLQLITVPVWVLSAVSLTPTEMRIFPRERYGQFCSANSLVRSVGLVLGGQMAGVFLDVMKRVHHGSDFAYRYIPAWQLVFQAMSFGCLFLLYREWQRLGADRGFVPPGLDSALVKTASEPVVAV